MTYRHENELTTHDAKLMAKIAAPTNATTTNLPVDEEGKPIKETVKAEISTVCLRFKVNVNMVTNFVA